MAETDNFYARMCRIRDAVSSRRYYERTSDITDKWQRARKKCECGGNHRAIGYKVGKSWLEICPIDYYLLLSWKAIAERRDVPSEEFFWELLNKEAPQREQPSELSLSEYWTGVLRLGPLYG